MFSLAHKHKHKHKHNISMIKWENRGISISISRSRKTNPRICLTLFSLAHTHKHKHKTNKHLRVSDAYDYAYALMLMLMRKWEQHQTRKWVRSSYVSAYDYVYVAGVLTCYAYALVRTSLYTSWWISLWYTTFNSARYLGLHSILLRH